MARRRLLLISSAFLAVLFLGFIFQSNLIGRWRGEAKYKGRYTNSWRAEMRQFQPDIGICESGRIEWAYRRAPTIWEEWLAKVLPNATSNMPSAPPPLQEGDPEALQVLIELLRAPEENVRMLAASGLERIGPEARQAVPALLVVLEEEDGYARGNASQALWEIDPRTMRSMRKITWVIDEFDEIHLP
jgi:hypothetical protein